MKIYAPNIHLFAFQLYKISNIDANNSLIDKNLLWNTGNEIVRTTLHQDLHLSQRLDVDKKPKNPRVDLLKDTEVIDDNYAVTFEGKVTLNQELLVNGFAYPLRLHDSYGLWLNLRRPETENNYNTDNLEIAFLRQLNPNNCLILPENPLFVGQTLLVTAWLTGAKDRKSSQEIANECLKFLFPDNYPLPPFNRQGELFGSPIFEYGLFSQSDNYQHVLIWLFADNQADTKFNQCYDDLVDLFFFRTKSVKAYKDSKKTYKKLDIAYREVEKTIEKLPKIDDKKSTNTANLTDLQNQLKALPQLALEYTRLLRDLEEQQNTIAIHTYNYNEKLQRIRDTIGNDISFLEFFSQKSSPYFQQQITADLGYFRHGLELLGKAIDSIRGIVEIEQAESDRSLERTIQILGIGFGGGAIISAIITEYINEINIPLAAISPKNPPHPFYASLFLSILVTLLFIGVGWLITKRRHYPRNKK
ncbi:hypothetical protein [Anabaena sp. CCY 0017]|uniref:hypothetical protein n=1 Tax=Anabaena sp. CCY 0017 TaxID=3103866 RepID=UPI0039C64F04